MNCENSTQDYLFYLKNNGVSFHLTNDEKLKYSDANNYLTPELIGELRSRKSEIISFLKKSGEFNFP